MEKRKIGIIVVGVAAGLLALSVLTRSWFSGSPGFGGADYSVGLRSFEACAEGLGCEVESWEVLRAPGTPDRYVNFIRFGGITFWFGLLSALLLAGTAVLAGLRHPRTPTLAKLAMIDVTLLALSALVFMVNKPEVFPGASWGIAAFMVSIMAAVIGAGMLARRELYPSDEPDPAALAAAEQDEFGGTFGL
jgi:hypothetical protein